ncbi:MAG: hypothetical protein MK212_14920 [Saprospiraceae bacterium]|nr:hypothetical protein [Saprospiraceae bacterium]
MKGIKNFFSLSLLIAVVAVFSFSSCSSDKNQKVDTSSLDNTRSLKAEKLSAEIKAKFEKATAIYGKTKAAFAAGDSDMDLSTLANLSEEDGTMNLNLVVLYESSADWAEIFSTGEYAKTGDDKFNGLLESYELVITKQFELDEYSEGLVLEPNSSLDDPVSAAREISLIDNVLMVHVKEVPTEVNEDDTAAGF